ncbi:unnamed protein product [Schistosoma mattheei]|uniref:Hydroxysteroid 17-beta dehydrogenase 12 n=1 Tax=Schistosoma mattheei TaxID=31246 RepID=A0AA85BP73_9TREM|nr:unnamed protein product [Schistosoma mattheei]
MSTLTFVELITENRLLLLTALIVSWISFKLSQLLLIYLKYTVGVWCLSKRKTLRQAGEWAVVTGASSGIGEAYAEELATEGLNIMLISNDEKQLSSVAKRIANTYNVQTRIVVADFTKNDTYDIIRPAIDQLSTIACLVNNVGMGLPLELFTGEMNSPNEESIRNIIHCNILSTVMMTSIILPKMLTQKGPNPGIINIASYSALRTTPYLTVYSSTKAFIIQFCKCLIAEKYQKNVIIQILCPLTIYTSMTKHEKPSYFNPSAKSFVHSALNMYGVVQQTTGYILHEYKAYFFDLLPTSLWILLTYARVNARKKYV